MEKVLQTVEGLIRRSIGPSVTLFVLVGLVDLLLAELTGTQATERIKAGLQLLKEGLDGTGNISFAGVAIIIIGMSYGLAMVQEVVFDNWLRKNFDPWTRRWKVSTKDGAAITEGQALESLRQAVVKRLDEEPLLERLRPSELESESEPSDYLLYEILGGIDPTDTRHYVDSAKSLGITSISLMLALLYGLLVYGSHLHLPAQIVLFLAVAFGAWFIGSTAIRAQFRARAIRLYVNFLAMPTDRITYLLNPEREAAAAKFEAKKNTVDQDGKS
ncbi:MAG: hypothetical protein AAGD38_03030 [Acidobacteriota bacterium]